MIDTIIIKIAINVYSFLLFAASFFKLVQALSSFFPYLLILIFLLSKVLYLEPEVKWEPDFGDRSNQVALRTGHDRVV